MWVSHARCTGKRSSTQCHKPVNQFILSLLIFANHNYGVALITMRRNFEVERRRHARVHTTSKVIFGAMARTEETTLPFIATEISCADIWTIHRSATEVSTNSQQDGKFFVDCTRFILCIDRLLSLFGLRIKQHTLPFYSF